MNWITQRRFRRMLTGAHPSRLEGIIPNPRLGEKLCTLQESDNPSERYLRWVRSNQPLSLWWLSMTMIS